MADDDSGSKTELPTTKRLRDARKKGDVPKSPDVGITLGFLFALLLLWLVFDQLVASLQTLTELTLLSPGTDFEDSVRTLGWESVKVFVNTSALILIPLALFGMVVEFLVIGPVITAEKFTPKMSHLNPAEGLKRMFGADNLVELVKSIVKTAILVLIAFIAIRSALGDLTLLVNARPEYIISAIWYLVLRVFGLASIAYVLLMFLDAGYQRYSFVKRMKMSMRDIRDEMKQTEGDPTLRGARRELGIEWSYEAPAQAARDATVLVVNPIHVAVAIEYDKERTRIPIVTGRGEEALARAMREAAADAGVPVLRNEALARALLADDNPSNHVPRELFDIVAEVLLWARAVRSRLEEPSATASNALPQRTPGEDLTDYSGFHRIDRRRTRP